jgi:choline-sulfatase
MTHETTRRGFFQAGAASAVTAAGVASAAEAPAAREERRPNMVFIVCDQLGLDALSAHGCPDVRTPNMDRLVRRGVTFLESHSTNPVCSPARSSLFTGRMPCETGVISNGRPIHPSVPNMGQWLRQAGYETVYSGKWHLPHGYPTSIEGFTVLPVGRGQGDLCDPLVSRSCEAWLKSCSGKKPFLLVASFLQPHDICYWAIRGSELVPEDLPFPHLADGLPDLPPNHKAFPKAPAQLDRIRYTGFTDEQWRYYIYTYYRQVEMADADIGRVVDAVEQAGEAEDTIIILTADHGEGRGRHSHVQKWYPYEEGVKVPLVVSCPPRMQQGVQDAEHLVSGLDVMATVCDYAGTEAPPNCRGRSLRPLLEGRDVPWREFVVSGHHLTQDRQTSAGHMVRTERFKYVKYAGDPVEQLFDMQADPWETRNLFEQAPYADEVAAHRKLLAQWQERLEPVPPTRDFSRPRRERKRNGKRS